MKDMTTEDGDSFTLVDTLAMEDVLSCCSEGEEVGEGEEEEDDSCWEEVDAGNEGRDSAQQGGSTE